MSEIIDLCAVSAITLESLERFTFLNYFLKSPSQNGKYEFDEAEE